MTGLLVLIQTVVLFGLGVVVARRAKPASAPYGRRLAAIAGLILASSALLYLFTFVVAPSDWLGRSGTFYGVVWLFQATRAALFIAAFGLWIGLVRPELNTRFKWAALVAIVGMGWGGGGFPIAGFLLVGWLATRFKWPGQIPGWRRAVILVIAPLLFVWLAVAPTSSVNSTGRDVGASTRLTTASSEEPTSLVTGGTAPAERFEIAVTRPLDRTVRSLLALFRVQLAVLTFQMLMMPIRLSGMSLKRRFTVNYVLVRQIPGALGFITLLVCAYLGLGVMKAQQARGELDRSLARGSATAEALLADPRIAHIDAETRGRLDLARLWLGPDSSRAHVLIRAWDAASLPDTSRAAEAVADSSTADSTAADSLAAPLPVLAASSMVPTTLAQARLPATRDGRIEGVIEAGDHIYLAARAVAPWPPPGRAVDVYVRVDSVFLTEIADRTATRMRIEVTPRVQVQAQGMSFSSDSSSTLTLVSAHSVVTDPATRKQRTFWLARSFLPYGDWRAGWTRNLPGAVSIELRTTLRLLWRNAGDLPTWLFSNVLTVGLVVGLTILIGMTESLAVRSGRTIVQAVEEEVGALRTATERFGAGDLAHRVPVRGKDELSMLAGSFNTMAANLERQRTELIEKERIEEDLEVARQIQRRFLPQRPPATRGLDVAGLSMPSKEVGGDLFYYVELPEDRLAIALGDVSGKSVPAALVMSNVMSALRAESQHESAVERSLERINRLIVEQIEPGRFVTLFYGVLDPAGGRMHYTSAGHNPVLRLSGAGEATWLSEGGVPLGVLPDARYPSADEPLLPGDTVVIYSDGVTEAEGNAPDGGVALFGEDRLVATVRGLRGESSEAIVQGIVAAVQAFAAGRPQADDITLVVVRRA